MGKQRKELILYCMQPFINIRKRKIDLSAHPPIITGNRNKKQQQYECDFCMLPLHFACLLLMAITYAVVVPRSVNSVGLISVAVNNVMLLLHCIYHTILQALPGFTSTPLLTCEEEGFFQKRKRKCYVVHA